MLIGTAQPESLAEGSATVESFGTDALRLEGVETFHLFTEIASAGVESLLPPGLHPTLPPAATWIVQAVAASPWDRSAGPSAGSRVGAGCGRAGSFGAL